MYQSCGYDHMYLHVVAGAMPAVCAVCMKPAQQKVAGKSFVNLSRPDLIRLFASFTWWRL